MPLANSLNHDRVKYIGHRSTQMYTDFSKVVVEFRMFKSDYICVHLRQLFDRSAKGSRAEYRMSLIRFDR